MLSVFQNLKTKLPYSGAQSYATQVQEEIVGTNDEEKQDWTPNNSRITKLVYPVMKLPFETYFLLGKQIHDHFAL